MTQIIRGQPVSTAISAPSTVSSTPAQKGLTSGTSTPSLQPSTSQPPRPQQGQVKLTMAQLTQLTQGHVSSVTSLLALEWSYLTSAVSFKTCAYFRRFKNVLVLRNGCFLESKKNTFFKKFYLFILLYNIVLVLPYIGLNLPWVYMCSPSWTLPPTSVPEKYFLKAGCDTPQLSRVLRLCAIIARYFIS